MRASLPGLLVAIALCLSGAAYGQDTADEGPFLGAAGTAVRPIDHPLFPVLEFQQNLRGVTSEATGNPTNSCFSAVPEDRFYPGDIAALSVLFEDTVEGDQVNEYEVSLALRGANRVVVLGTFHCAFDLSFAPPGAGLSLCCYIIDEVPLLPATVDIEWGARVVKSESGYTTQGLLGTARIGP